MLIAYCLLLIAYCLLLIAYCLLSRHFIFLDLNTDISKHGIIKTITISLGNPMAMRKYLENSPSLAEGVYIDESAVVIGRVTFGKDSSVWPLSVIRGDVQEISIGERTNIQDGSILHVTSPESYGPDGFELTIGNDVTVGHRVVLHGCVIRDRALIGMGAIIMDGVVIETDVIVGAGSVVSPGKTLESGGLYVGSPAKRVRNLKQEELDFLVYSSAHYVKLKNLHQKTS